MLCWFICGPFNGLSAIFGCYFSMHPGHELNSWGRKSEIAVCPKGS